ncbi:crossover junction endodeoxyribonuclease RuvC [candidate division WWE3 bacterium CG_4_9_14_0_2_um_filter_48_10]|uniref:Crossover junction endodeoxyribonuclease RuvC n=1 Tax=candidate division WWE3 bacterium CG_4_9_14_0_2_um_filter_48_10 TaxID=1975078 RepID=A0A2M8EIH4_UNCKA|nr:MAG: crossover junction endodeoxyribonuclease RuvC [candidate division WWE3 bacterium CG_4_9_14_0_2_um_filter_48_10]
MIILGIDPGTAKMGWGIIQYQKSQPKAGPPRAEKIKHLGHGLIKTPSSDSIGKRLAVLKEEVEHLLKEHKVDEVVVEKIFFNINKRSAISVGQALGIVHLAAAEFDIPVYEYNSLEVKLLLAGYGRADKKVVQKEMKRRLRLKKHPTPVHAADALAAAFCHILKTHAV